MGDFPRGTEGGISREHGSVARIKSPTKFLASRRGAKCFLPLSRGAEPGAFCRASSLTSTSTIRYTGAALAYLYTLVLSADVAGVVKRNFNHILRD